MFTNIEELLKALKEQVLPSVKAPEVKLPSVKSKQTKIPGVEQGSKKNPFKVLQQIKNKDVKDIKMKEAQEQLNINKSTGQWSLKV